MAPSFHALTFFLQSVEREPLIYHLDSMSRHSEDHSDLPDEFFEVTVDDVRKRFAQLKSERWEKEVNGSSFSVFGSEDCVRFGINTLLPQKHVWSRCVPALFVTDN